MQLAINPGDEVPIYRQICRQITDLIAGGRLGPGEKLPSHRELAARLVIAPLTVKKAYDVLEAEGFLGTQRGRGTYVSLTLPAIDPALLRERLRESARRLVREATLGDVSLDEIVELLRDVTQEMKP